MKKATHTQIANAYLAGLHRAGGVHRDIDYLPEGSKLKKERTAELGKRLDGLTDALIDNHRLLTLSHP